MHDDNTFGTTGEGASFSRRQKMRAHEALLAAGIGAERILPAVMVCSIDEDARRLADFAAMGSCFPPSPAAVFTCDDRVLSDLVRAGGRG